MGLAEFCCYETHPVATLAKTKKALHPDTVGVILVLGLPFDSMSPMALVLVGQTEIWDRLRLQRYAAVRQRIDINCVLPHLDRAETEKYIRSHLEYAGGRQEIFTDKAIGEIFRESTGIPRRINRICEGCLMYASQQGKRLTDEHQVRFVLEHEMLGGEV